MRLGSAATTYSHYRLVIIVAVASVVKSTLTKGEEAWVILRQCRPAELGYLLDLRPMLVVDQGPIGTPAKGD